jgi:hypothetical protein
MNQNLIAITVPFINSLAACSQKQNDSKADEINNTANRV